MAMKDAMTAPSLFPKASHAPAHTFFHGKADTRQELVPRVGIMIPDIISRDIIGLDLVHFISQRVCFPFRVSHPGAQLLTGSFRVSLLAFNFAAGMASKPSRQNLKEEMPTSRANILCTTPRLGGINISFDRHSRTPRAGRFKKY
jgi:hypothetical protein